VVLQYNAAYLSHLIRLRLVAFTLQVHLFLDSSFAKDVMTAANSHFKTQAFEELAKVFESNARIRGSTDHTLQGLARTHASFYTAESQELNPSYRHNLQDLHASLNAAATRC
jgi:hypothetical protein